MKLLDFDVAGAWRRAWLCRPFLIAEHVVCRVEIYAPECCHLTEGVGFYLRAGFDDSFVEACGKPALRASPLS